MQERPSEAIGRTTKSKFPGAARLDHCIDDHDHDEGYQQDERRHGASGRRPTTDAEPGKTDETTTTTGRNTGTTRATIRNTHADSSSRSHQQRTSPIRALSRRGRSAQVSITDVSASPDGKGPIPAAVTIRRSGYATKTTGTADNNETGDVGATGSDPK